MPEPEVNFTSRRDGAARVVPVVARDELIGASGQLLDRLRRVPWSRLRHAYGEAFEVPALIYAVHVGHLAVREAAWWELWGNLHHQGTVYEATLHAVPFFSAVAEARDHPDRVQALAFLRQVAVANGKAAEDVRAAVRSRAPGLLRDWAHEPVPIQRALLWLASAFPEIVAEYPGLVRVPDVHLAAWDVLITNPEGYGNLCDADQERCDAFERWVFAG